jgi:hypothetical protein
MEERQLQTKSVNNHSDYNNNIATFQASSQVQAKIVTFVMLFMVINSAYAICMFP